jgi:ABC-2 type transport system ATP-binding protein
MAVCGRPQLLFLDEPTTGLDFEAREALWATVRKLVQGGCSVVLTTHYLEEAEALADRIAVLNKGRIVAQGNVDTIRSVVGSKRITCVTSVGADLVKQWPGVMEVTICDRKIEITTSHPESIVRRLLNADENLRELQVKQAGLAEAFVELTREAA